ADQRVERDLRAGVGRIDVSTREGLAGRTDARAEPGWLWCWAPSACAAAEAVECITQGVHRRRNAIKCTGKAGNIGDGDIVAGIDRNSGGSSLVSDAVGRIAQKRRIPGSRGAVHRYKGC